MKTSVKPEWLATFASKIFQVETINELPIEQIYTSLKRDKFVCIRGLVSAAEILTAKKALTEQFSRKNDRPTVGESPDDVKTNFQKLSVGGEQSQYHLGTYRPKLVRTFYNPLWQKDIYKMHEIFRKTIAVRNKLLGKLEDFASDRVEDGLWTAARIHQYPLGGGFMGAHQDITLTKVANQSGLNYYQLLLVMSKKGVDFETGGGFVELDGKRFIFEEACNLGDIIIYDSQTVHGVEDIDPHKLLDLDSFSGRIAGFVSLYRSI